LRHRDIRCRALAKHPPGAAGVRPRLGQTPTCAVAIAPHTRAAVILNRHFLVIATSTTPSGLQLPSYAQALNALRASLGTDDTTAPPGLDPAYWEEMKDVLDSLPPADRFDAAGRLLPPLDKATPRTPRGIYNLACWYASCTPAPDTDPSEFRAKAVALLNQVVTDPDIKAWMTKDPQLAKLRDDNAYKESFLDDPETDFFALPELSPYAQRLRDAGFGNVKTLHSAGTNGDPVLQGLLAGQARQQITEMAGIQISLREVPALRDSAVEILRRLSARGLATMAALKTTSPEDHGAASSEIRKELADRFRPSKIPPDTSDLAGWWGHIADEARTDPSVTTTGVGGK